MNDTTQTEGAPTPEDVAKKAEAAKVKADAAAAKKAEKEQAKALKAKTKADDKAAKVQAKLDAKEAKKADRMPEQNGVRRPKPETKCGKAWAVFDEVSSKTGSPATIADSMVLTKAAGMNDGNVRAEYARWRKFHGIVGRLEAPKPAAQETAAQ